MPIVEVCPVCEGRGEVPLDFYDEDGYLNSTEPFRKTEDCRSCNGRGYVIVEDLDVRRRT
jgi:hypothetical protein